MLEQQYRTILLGLRGGSLVILGREGEREGGEWMEWRGVRGVREVTQKNRSICANKSQVGTFERVFLSTER
jgi:hypothetical protein